MVRSGVIIMQHVHSTDETRRPWSITINNLEPFRNIGVTSIKGPPSLRHVPLHHHYHALPQIEKSRHLLQTNKFQQARQN